MLIERVRIQGFKSIRDLTLEGLGKVNVFHGLNDVGKSNILQAIQLAHQVLTGEQALFPIREQSPDARSPAVEPPAVFIKRADFANRYGTFLFRLGGDRHFTIEMETSFLNSELPSGLKLDSSTLKTNVQLTFQDIGDSIAVVLDRYLVVTDKETVDARKSLNLQWSNWIERLQRSYWQRRGFRLIEATRRICTERSPQTDIPDDADLIDIVDYNLKLGLFYTYLSPDTQQKRNLEKIRHLLTEPPFNLGQLDIALDRKTNTLDVGFVRGDGRLPIESLGSGTQQLLLVLGQVFLNANRIIAIEEPEMNLSPVGQRMLFSALKALLNDSNGLLDQLFISSHSPAFEFQETFFDVTFEDGETKVRRAPLSERGRYFGEEHWGPDSGSRLNSQNQVTLFPDVVEDMSLQRGDLIFFVKNERGFWELCREEQILPELQEILQNEQ